MDRVAQHRDIVRRAVEAHVAEAFIEPELEIETVINDAQGHYEVLLIGWQGMRRVHGAVLHIDVRDDGKAWIQHDGTEEGFAHELVRAGISKDQIVLAYHAPYKRPYTGFAVA